MLLGYFIHYEYLYQKKKNDYYGNRDLVVGAKIAVALKTVENSAQKYAVLLAGDSRTLFQLDPQIFNKNSLPAYNIGCEGCELINFWNAHKAFSLENKIPIFIVSIGAYQLNDNSPDYLADENFYRMTSLERIKILGADYFQKSKWFLHNRWPREEYLIKANDSLPTAETQKTLGYKMNPPPKTPYPVQDPIQCNMDYIHRHPWYKNGKFNQARLRILQEIITEMAKSKSKFILFNAPINPNFKFCIQNTPVATTEKFFSTTLKEFTKGIPNIQFLDFYETETVPGLDINGFSDPQHLNHNGAILLSQYFINFLKKNYSADKL